jgi:hypothetical protein
VRGGEDGLADEEGRPGEEDEKIGVVEKKSAG